MRVRSQATQPWASDALDLCRQDFKNFHADSFAQTLRVQEPHLDLLIVDDVKAIQPFVFEFRNARAYGLSKRFVRYNDGAKVLLEKKQCKQTVLLAAPNPERLRELLYILISAQVGWLLEKDGWVRLHAAAFTDRGSVRIIFGESGLGKSTAAGVALFRGEKVWSDDLLMVSPDRRIHPWPCPLKLSPDSLKLMGIQPQVGSAFPRALFGTKHQVPIPEHQVGEITPIGEIESPYSRFEFGLRVLTGLGLMQMLEFNLRLDMVGTLTRIALRRLFFLFWYHFRKGTGIKRKSVKEIRAHALSGVRENTL